MPRYFFHVIDGRVMVDNEGTELSGLDDARNTALMTAGEILAMTNCTELNGVHNGTPWTLTVADETGKTVYSLSFQAREYP